MVQSASDPRPAEFLTAVKPRRLDPGGFGTLPCAGPLSTSVRDAEYFMKAVLACDSWTLDEGIITVPWRQLGVEEGKKDRELTLGFILEDA